MNFEHRISPACQQHLTQQIVPQFLGPAGGGHQQRDPPLPSPLRGDGETLGKLCAGSSAPEHPVLAELQAEKERGPPSPPQLPPPPCARTVLGAVPRTSGSQSRDLTRRLCFLLKFCKSTSVRQVLVGCDGLLGKPGAGARQTCCPTQPTPMGTTQPPGHPHIGASPAPPLLAGCCHQPFASTELHPLPTGNLKATFKLIYLLLRVVLLNGWHFLPTPESFWRLECLSPTHINSRPHLRREH